MSFVEKHNLWNSLQADLARELADRIRRDCDVVRFAFADQHGLIRGKTLVASEALSALHAGVRLVSTLLLKDSANKTAWPVFSQGGGFGSKDFEGANDVVLVADPTTFKMLPWAERTGWVQCEAHFPDGRAVPFDTRGAMRRALTQLEAQGYELITGLEVEFHVFRVTDPRLALDDSGWPGSPPEVSLVHAGYQLLSEQRYDQAAPIIEILRKQCIALGLPVYSVEIELGPSQFEFVFDVGVGLASADAMILFRNAAKQIMRRNGYHATFMCRPQIPNVMSSGWHLHQSLRELDTDDNAFTPEVNTAATANLSSPTSAARYLSEIGQHYLGGLLANAAGYAAFATPTINGYRRYHRAGTLAPISQIWGHDNRGAMLRVIGAANDPATRIENRIGEPAANPYLYVASQIYAGLDGIARRLDPGPGADTPYAAQAPHLPATLEHAIAGLRASPVMRAGFGDDFVNYYARIKDFELARFNAEVTEWEQREYFDLF